MKVAIGAIFKNEFEYILEWVAYHRLIGFENIYVADNGSSDGSSELLAALDDLGLITRIYFPTQSGISPQLPAYEKIIDEFSHEFDVIGFIDCDEFISSQTSYDNVSVLISHIFESNSDVSALGLNWALYGSSGKLNKEEKLVIERFSNHADKDTGVNRHIKSFLRVDRFDGFYSPHSVKINSGYYVDTTKNKLTLDENTLYGCSDKVCWENIRINHYVIKSWQEFKEKKQTRGRATTELTRDDGFFKSHDLNDCSSRDMWHYIDPVQKEVQRLKRLLKQKNGYNGSCTLHIDYLDDSILRGWVFTPNKESSCKLLVWVNGQKEFIVTADLIRPDVYSHLKDKGCANECCGFKFNFPERLEPGSKIELKVFGCNHLQSKTFFV